MKKIIVILLVFAALLFSMGCGDESKAHDESGDDRNNIDMPDDENDIVNNEEDNEEPECDGYGNNDCLYSWIGTSHCQGEREYVYCEIIEDDPCMSGSRDKYGECSSDKMCGECDGSVECVDETVFKEKIDEYLPFLGTWKEVERIECDSDSSIIAEESEKIKIVINTSDYGQADYIITDSEDKEKWSRWFCMLDIQGVPYSIWKPTLSLDESDNLVISNMDELDTGTFTLDDEIKGFCKFVFEKVE
jgi:hypothetical protein